MSLLTLKENDKYYYDKEAAEKPITFIERFLCHYEGVYAGKPFLLLDWQKKIIRDLFGWKRRSDGLRRFREVYMEIAKGNGKSPFITAIACYLFFGEAERGQQIFSIATDYQQANITFDMASKMIAASPKLAARVEIKQREIVYEERNSKWSVMSGTAEGKHGFRPNCIVADEAHEWDNRKLYDNVTSNLLKRSQPLMLIATNAGANRQSICWELHERAERVLGGRSQDETLYPILYAADKDDDWQAVSTWEKANPSLGKTITIDALRTELIKAKENPALEARFRRLYLSQWIQGSNKWLDMSRWDSCVGKVEENLKALPMYLGMDLSFDDDLSALVAVWIGKEKLYVKSWFYVPRASAFKYEDMDSTPFTDWANSGYVRFLEGDTVDEIAHKRIAKFIGTLAEKYNLKGVAYDSARASRVVALTEKQGITCIPTPQAAKSLSPACFELVRRLKAGTIVLPNNPCFRWQAANVEVFSDSNGNIRPIKEASKGRYAGRKGCKIDGISALVTALSEVCRLNVATDNNNALAAWSGEIIGV